MSDGDLLWQLVQERAVTSVLIAYCVGVDSIRIDDAVDCFTTDCTFDGGHGRRVHGHAELRTFLATRLTRYISTSHHLSNSQVRFPTMVNALASSYVYAFHRFRKSGRTGFLWGRYTDELVLTNGRWLIASRLLRAADDEGFDPAPGDTTAFERVPRG